MNTYAINNELNGIEVIFDSKPGEAILSALKNAGFRWHKVKKLWYAKNTPERLTLAQEITGGTSAPSAPTSKDSKNKLLSLWERCKVDDIPEHDRHNIDTKAIAAETRKHIKERFPELKFSCRIGSGGWAACNEVNFHIIAAPYGKDSVYLEAILKYVKAWLWSFNYDKSDSMTDYFNRGFYETVALDYHYEETTPTEEQASDIENYNIELQKFNEEEEKRREAEFQQRLIEEEESRKRQAEIDKIVKGWEEEIINHVSIVDIEETEKYIISGEMICGCGKECNIEELRKDNEPRVQSALITRELHFTDEAIYNNFCKLFLHDFDFLVGFGGTGTLDKRVTDDNYRQLNARQRETVKWILWNSIAVFVNNELKLVIDPEGYSYARYVNIVEGAYITSLLSEAEAQEEKKQREDFYIPLPIKEQAQEVEPGQNYTLIYVDPWIMKAQMQHIKITDKNIMDYAQYKDSLYIEYVEEGKRKTEGRYFHDKTSVLLYKDYLPAVPTSLTQRVVSDSMYELLTAGVHCDDFMINVYRYYKDLGFTPVINAMQF